MLVLAGIEAEELHGLAFIPEAEKGELLIEGGVEVVSLEVVVEGATEGVVIVVAGNGVIA